MGAKAVVKGYYGMQNLGDDYILSAVVSTLSKAYGAGTEVNVLGSGSVVGQIEELFPQHRFRTLDFSVQGNKLQRGAQRVAHRLSLISRLRGADVFLFGGGGAVPRWQRAIV